MLGRIGETRTVGPGADNPPALDAKFADPNRTLVSQQIRNPVQVLQQHRGQLVKTLQRQHRASGTLWKRPELFLRMCWGVA
jgi:hypothetical protein